MGWSNYKPFTISLAATPAGFFILWLFCNLKCNLYHFVPLNISNDIV